MLGRWFRLGALEWCLAQSVLEWCVAQSVLEWCFEQSVLEWCFAQSVLEWCVASVRQPVVVDASPHLCCCCSRRRNLGSVALELDVAATLFL